MHTLAERGIGVRTLADLLPSNTADAGMARTAPLQSNLTSPDVHAAVTALARPRANP